MQFKYKKLFKKTKGIENYNEVDCGTHIFAIYEIDGVRHSSKFAKLVSEITKSTITYSRQTVEENGYNILIDIINDKKYINSIYKIIETNDGKPNLIKYMN